MRQQKPSPFQKAVLNVLEILDGTQQQQNNAFQARQRIQQLYKTTSPQHVLTQEEKEELKLQNYHGCKFPLISLHNLDALIIYEQVLLALDAKATTVPDFIQKLATIRNYFDSDSYFKYIPATLLPKNTSEFFVHSATEQEVSKSKQKRIPQLAKWVEDCMKQIEEFKREMQNLVEAKTVLSPKEFMK